MEHVLLFSLLLLFSTGLCDVNSADDISTGTRLVCQPDTCSVISELAAMREKMESMSQAQRSLTDSLKASSELVQDLKRDVQDLKKENQDLKAENQAQGEQLKALKDIVGRERATVAFSASLGTSMGPFQQDMPVKYPRVLSNVGSGYNPATGSFTAPLRGVYYFIYTMYNNNSGRSNSVVSLMKNEDMLVATWDTVDDNSHDSATNMAVVQLEAGDSVYVKLRAHRQLYDDTNYYNSFAGFLLFTV